ATTGLEAITAEIAGVISEVGPNFAAAPTITSTAVTTLNPSYGGNFEIAVAASLTASAAGVVSFQLQQNGVDIGPLLEQTVTTPGLITFSPTFITPGYGTFFQNAAQLGPQTFGWTASTSAGTIACAAGSSSITVTEVGA